MNLNNEEFTMDVISKLERTVLGWAKNVPHLPAAGQKWLGANVWWIALVVAIISGIMFLFNLARVFTSISLVGAVSSAYYVTDNYISIIIMSLLVDLVFITATTVLLGIAVKPLQKMQKKGWVLLLMTLLVQALSVVVYAVLTFSIVGFILNIIFGAVVLAIVAYFVAEIHGQFGLHARATAKKA